MHGGKSGDGGGDSARLAQSVQAPTRRPARSNRTVGTQYGGCVRLERILETVLCYSSGQEEELARFYGEVLDYAPSAAGGLTFRVGRGLAAPLRRRAFVRPVATPSARRASARSTPASSLVLTTTTPGSNA